VLDTDAFLLLVLVVVFIIVRGGRLWHPESVPVAVS
jgi:hypothetical protein